jgi:putative tryptophan/tyrosine transport system substrate-binding protein
MRRRDFINAVAGAVTVWPLSVRAQQGDRIRRIGVLSNLAQDDKEDQRRVEAFRQALQGLGWTVGRNIQIDYRWGAGKADFYRRQAAELIALAPDVILTNGTTTIGPMLQTTQTVPVVFVNVTDPVSGGFVESLARPGGNATGFASAEYGSSGKWLQLLKQIGPEVKRAAVLRDPSTASGSGQLGAIQAVGPLLGVEINSIDVRDAGEIERGLMALASFSNTGLIVTASGASIAHRDLIIALAARLKWLAVYWQRVFATDGGLISYGDAAVDQYRRAAGYVDRILKGEKPGDLPVQAPTKFETVINLKTAKALGISMPLSLIVSADEVIE